MANYSSTSASSSSNLNNSVKRTKILLLGLRRSGKTSIQQVLFNDLSPKQTFYLEPTMRVVKHAYDTLIPLEIWDCPGNITVDTLGAPLSQFSSIIFVIDIRDLYNQAISKLVEFIVASYHQNPNINFEVFVHKAEKLQEDDKIENFRQIHERVSDRLLDISSEEASYEQVQLNFHLTSVYDHSLHEAFSRVLHKLVDSLPYLEDLLNGFCANSQSPKAFLFDISSRLYIATDASPVDSATHNLCCDYLGMINAFGPLYRSKVDSSPRQQRVTPSSGAPSEHSPDSPSASQPQTPPPTAVTPTAIHSPAEPSWFQSPSPTVNSIDIIVVKQHGGLKQRVFCPSNLKSAERPLLSIRVYDPVSYAIRIYQPQFETHKSCAKQPDLGHVHAERSSVRQPRSVVTKQRDRIKQRQ
ncbi:GTP-binding protein gtr2 [Pleurotus ostreatus]|nr:GTP-binding protein gtr2 [Pleurotus ostreatus]